MSLMLIFLTNLLLISAQIEMDDGYCDITTNSCEQTKDSIFDQKLLLYDINPPEGFNLRRDVYMRFAIWLSTSQKRGKMKNFNLVLPPWYNLYHWKTTSQKTEPIPWGHFFDVTSLKSFAPVVELHEIFERNPKKPLVIDTIYVLQNYEDPFENGIFEDKWETQEECSYSPIYFGYTNITADEIICVKFQGKISMLQELFQLHPKDKIIMVAHAEIPLHDNYGDKKYWECRKSMKFNDNLHNIASKFIKEKLNCDTDCNYLGVHWRRQDFAKYRTKDVPSITGTAKQLHEIMSKTLPDSNTIFIATDATTKEKESLKSQLKANGYKVHFYLPNHNELLKDGSVAIIEQIICSKAAYFIGTHESTFTFRIQEEREILGFPEDSTFNRLCPDKGRCEKPSRWTIVN